MHHRQMTMQDEGPNNLRSKFISEPLYIAMHWIEIHLSMHFVPFLNLRFGWKAKKTLQRKVAVSGA